MIDSKGAAQAAFHQALDGAAAVTADSKVFQHVPEDEELGAGEAWVIVGDLSSEALGGKDGGLDRVVVEILVVANELDQTALTSRQARVRTALEESDLPEQEGVAISRPVFEGDEARLAEDGQTYFGIQRFSVFVQESDYGPELLVDGVDFIAGYTNVSGTDNADGAVNLASGMLPRANLALQEPLEVGAEYRLAWTLANHSAGLVRWIAGGAATPYRDADSEYEEAVTPASVAATIQIYGSDARASVLAASLRKRRT